MVLILSKLVGGAIATFLAIILWSQTRDAAWMFVIIGIIVSYGETVLSTLEFFGLVSIELYPIYGVSVFRILFGVLPALFFSIGFGVVIARKMR